MVVSAHEITQEQLKMLAEGADLKSHSDKKVHLVSLGCARNRVDSEVMLGSLLAEGWSITDHREEADSIIVNTCGFIDKAKTESVDTILECATYKKKRPDLKLIVAGCLTQRYKTQLSQGLPEVDLFIGTDEFVRLPELMKTHDAQNKVFAKRTNYLYTDSSPRINTLARESAYVKVAEGCQHSCSFCIIPAIRGPLRSRSIESVVKEVMFLVESGVKEINLIAQDLAAYGRDRKDQVDLVTLLKALTQIQDLPWIRLLYVYPENITPEFIELLKSEPRILRYMDIPVQHASNKILQSMKRAVTREDLERIFGSLRDHFPDISLRTSVMVGFPGETEEDFEQLKDFVAKMEFDHLGCFTYSQEENTPAGRMADQIDEDVKLERQRQIMEIQQDVSRHKLKKYIGQRIPVLVSGLSEESELLWEGRAIFQAPEVDGKVYINDGDVKVGVVQHIEITESHDYDLIGRSC